MDSLVTPKFHVCILRPTSPFSPGLSSTVVDPGLSVSFHYKLMKTHLERQVVLWYKFLSSMTQVIRTTTTPVTLYGWHTTVVFSGTVLPRPRYLRKEGRGINLLHNSTTVHGPYPGTRPLCSISSMPGSNVSHSLYPDIYFQSLRHKFGTEVVNVERPEL